MEIICPIDAQYSDQIAELLKPPPPLEVQKYFEELLATRQCDGIKVKPTPRYGKGVYAETDFKEEDLVLKDQMLAGAQHPSNKVDCLVCSYCFCFVGSIELQIGRKLYLEQLGVSPIDECHMQKDCYNSDSSVGEDDSDVEDQQVSGECASSPSKDKISLPKDVVESLFNGEMRLPYSEKFSMPPIVSCPGGCKENYYCSKSCAEADWESFHSLLCTGEGSKSLSTKALQKFIEHANDTNDIFLLAAKVISFTILRHKNLKESRHEGKGKQVISESIDFSLLGEAWKPVSMGYKRRWWDCPTAAMPLSGDGADVSAGGRCTCSSLDEESLIQNCQHCRRSTLPSSSSSCSLLSLESYPVQDYDKLWRIFSASVKGFTIGAGLKGGLAIFAVLSRLRRRKSMSSAKKGQMVSSRDDVVLALKETLRYGLFLGTFSGTFVSVDEIVSAWGGHRRTAKWRALLAGAIAGPSLLLTGNTQHTSLAVYILVRAAVLASRCGIKSKRFGRICKPLTWAHGDIFLMCLSSSQILSAYILKQDSLHPSYKSFLNKHGGKALVILQGVKDLACGNSVMNLEAIENHYKSNGINIKLDPQMKVPCSVCHSFLFFGRNTSPNMNAAFYFSGRVPPKANVATL